jgi:hypothetical protein
MKRLVGLVELVGLIGLVGLVGWLGYMPAFPVVGAMKRVGAVREPPQGTSFLQRKDFCSSEVAPWLLTS